MTALSRNRSGRGRRTWAWAAGVLLLVAAVAVAWTLTEREDATVAGVDPTPSATVEPTPQPTPEPAPPSEPEPTREPEPTPELTPTPERTPAPEATPQAQALTGAGDGPFSGSPDDPGLGGSWIADVRSARHAGFDRVVVEFDGDYVPTYRVAYTATLGPFYDIPGDVVPISGSAFLDVWLQGTSRVDMANDYEPVYTGTRRVRSDTLVVTEVVEIEDFEANVHWCIGLDARSPFVAWTLDSPARLVIDVAH